MIVVKIELWNKGKEDDKRVLGLMNIVNDLTGTPDKGNYICRIYEKGGKGEKFREARIVGYPRLRDIWFLIFRAMRGFKEKGLI